MSSHPYSSVINVECSNVCLLYNNIISKNEASQKILLSSLLTLLKDKAERWSLVLLPRDGIFMLRKELKSVTQMNFSTYTALVELTSVLNWKRE